LAATVAFSEVDADIVLDWRASHGGPGVADEGLAVGEGPLAAVLTAERTAPKLLRHLSRVATLTRQYVDATYGSTPMRDTRNTTPGLRALEKAAVRAGGGVNHRGSLSDGILVKDNHLAGLSIEQAVEQAHRRWPGIPCEVECDTLEQVNVALSA